MTQYQKLCDSISKLPHLVLDRSNISLLSPVQLAWGLQEVGLHEERPLGLSVVFMLVTIHDLPEFLMGLKMEMLKDRVRPRTTQIQTTKMNMRKKILCQ